MLDHQSPTVEPGVPRGVGASLHRVVATVRHDACMSNGRVVKRRADATDPFERPQAVRWPWLLSDAGVLTAALIVAGVGVVALVVMLQIADHASTAERANLQIEALKYGVGFFAAAGAVAALLLAVRRQRLSEHTHELALEAQRLFERNHQLAMKAQAHTETDAAERRVTDLYGKAVEQLGSADAAVRLGGLYALERVAQNNPGQRQTIVNVLCAYLRMPYTPPNQIAWPGSAESAPTGPLTELPLRPPPPSIGRDSHQELQVRITAQRILTTHLTPPDDVEAQDAETPTPALQPFWPDIDLDLTGAALTDWTLKRGHVRTATFASATFTGDTTFEGATFTGDTTFDRAAFTNNGRFDEATFIGNAGFKSATFTGAAGFDKATFTGAAGFNRATFGKGGYGSTARFNGATFTGKARFDKATFVGDAWFDEATFTGDSWFAMATFDGDAGFDKATFIGNTRFDGATFGRALLTQARVAPRDDRGGTWPAGWRLVSGPVTGRLVYEKPTRQAVKTPGASGQGTTRSNPMDLP